MHPAENVEPSHWVCLNVDLLRLLYELDEKIDVEAKHRRDRDCLSVISKMVFRKTVCVVLTLEIVL